MIKAITLGVFIFFSICCSYSNSHAVERSSFPLLNWWVPCPAIRGNIDGDNDEEAGGGVDRWKIADWNYYQDPYWGYDGEFINMWWDYKPYQQDHPENVDYAAITMHLGDTTIGEDEHPVKLCDTIARAGFDSFNVQIVWSGNDWENYWFFKKDYTYEDSSGQVHDLNTDQDLDGTSDFEEAYLDWLDQAQLYGLKVQMDVPCYFMDNRTPYDDIFPYWVQRYPERLPDASLPPFVISSRPYAYSPWIYFQDADDFSKNIGGNPDNPTIHTPPAIDEWWYDDNQNRSWTCNWGGDVEYTIDVATEPDLWDGYALRYWARMNEVWDSPECLGYRLVDEPFAWDFFDMAVQMRLTHDMSLYEHLSPPREFIPQTWKKPGIIKLMNRMDTYDTIHWGNYPYNSFYPYTGDMRNREFPQINNPYDYEGKGFYDWMVHCYLPPIVQAPPPGGVNENWNDLIEFRVFPIRWRYHDGTAGGLRQLQFGFDFDGPEGNDGKVETSPELGGYDGVVRHLNWINLVAQKYDCIFWNEIQAFGDNSNSYDDNWYYPSREELRAEIELSLACGAKGIGIFGLVSTAYKKWAELGGCFGYPEFGEWYYKQGIGYNPIYAVYQQFGIWDGTNFDQPHAHFYDWWEMHDHESVKIKDIRSRLYSMRLLEATTPITEAQSFDDWKLSMHFQQPKIWQNTEGGTYSWPNPIVTCPQSQYLHYGHLKDTQNRDYLYIVNRATDMENVPIINPRNPDFTIHLRGSGTGVRELFDIPYPYFYPTYDSSEGEFTRPEGYDVACPNYNNNFYPQCTKEQNGAYSFAFDINGGDGRIFFLDRSQLQNGSFDVGDSLTGWVALGNPVVDHGAYFDRYHSLKFTVGAMPQQTVNNVQQYIDATGDVNKQSFDRGQNYQLSAMVKTANLVASDIYLRFSWYNNNGNKLADIDSAHIKNTLSQWTKLSVTIPYTPIPPGAVYGKASIQVGGGVGASGTCWVDAVKFQPDNMLYDFSFEYDGDYQGAGQDNIPEGWEAYNSQNSPQISDAWKKFGTCGMVINFDKFNNTTILNDEFISLDRGSVYEFSGWGSANICTTQLVLYCFDGERNIQDEGEGIIPLGSVIENAPDFQFRSAIISGDALPEWTRWVKVGVTVSPSFIGQARWDCLVLKETNLVSNGGFEADDDNDGLPDRWVQITTVPDGLKSIEFDDRRPKFGDRALMLRLEDTPNVDILEVASRDLIALPVGCWVSASAWFGGFPQVQEDEDRGKSNLGIIWYDQYGAELSKVYPQSEVGPLDFGSWQKLSLLSEPPIGAKFYRLVIKGIDGCSLVDGVVSKISSAP